MEEIKDKKEENTKMKLNRTNFKFELATKIQIRIGDRNFIEKIIELPQNKIGILYGIESDKSLFLIYSSKTFTMIKQFELLFTDSVKTEDNNLVLSDAYNIYYYELIDKEYKLIQKIQCYEKEEKKENNHRHRRSRNPNTSINFIHPLKNGNLIVCSYNEMKIYKKEDGKFLYDHTLDTEYFIREIFEIKQNIIVILLRKRLGSGCQCFGFKHYISLCNIEKYGDNILRGREFNYDDRYNKKPFLKFDNHLIAKYADYLDIYDIEEIVKLIDVDNFDIKIIIKWESYIKQNMKLINEDDYETIKISDWREETKLKYEVPFKYFIVELKKNFILVTKKDRKLFVYKYEDKSFKECQEFPFPFDLEKANIIKLKNDKLIIYYKDVINIINIFY